MSSRARSRPLLGLWAALRGHRRAGQPSATTSLRTLPRLLGAVASGRYRGLSGAQLGLMALALGYVLSPVDLLPESLLLGAGLLDDGVVLAWLAGAVLAETDAFLAWERQQRSAGTRGRAEPPRGTRGPRPERAPRSGDDPDVVVGEVIR